MIFANEWYNKSFENIWNSKISKQIDRDEKIVSRSEFLIKIFDVNRTICILMTNANLCEIFEIEIIAIDKESDLQSIRKKCKRWHRWWNMQTIENLFFQNLMCNLKCKKSKTRTFECNEIINANVEFLQHQIEYTMRRAIWSC